MHTSSVVILQHILICELCDSIFLLLIIHIREVSLEICTINILSLLDWFEIMQSDTAHKDIKIFYTNVRQF